LNQAIRDDRHYLPENDSFEVFSIYGMPLVSSFLATAPEEAVSAARRIGFPVVMKVVSDQIIHKSDVGGVALNIENEEQILIAWKSIMDLVGHNVPMAVIKGILVEKMISGGTEVILGIKRDPSFGPLIMFGLGGVYVEVFKDVSFRVAPFDEVIADAMMRQIKSFRILDGYRGKSRRDLLSIRDCLLRLSQLAMECPQIKELDINPLIVLEEGKGCYVADARILLGDLING